MAALTPIRVTERLPLGNVYEQVFRVTTSSGASNEWIATGFSVVLAAFISGIGNSPVGNSVQPNAQGTGSSENSSMGDVGVRVNGAGDAYVRVIGRP